MAETNTMDVIFVDYLLPGEPEDAEKHRVTLREFLAFPSDQLTEQNQKIQKALGQLYQLNDREPPLFKSFPKREKPLVVDCTPIKEANFGACYVDGENKVKIVESSLKHTELGLINVFAHELKHAEQFSEELCKIVNAACNNDGLAFHQLGYLIEAQAYAFDGYVSYLAQLNSKEIELDLSLNSQFPYFYYEYYQYYQEELPVILEKHTKGKSVDDFYDIQCEIMEKALPLIYEDESYRDGYDLDWPILRKNKGLAEGKLPVSFHFKDSQEAFSLLKDMPRKARTLEGIARQYRQDNSEIIDALEDSYSAESLKQLVEEGLKSGEISSEGLLFVVKETFTSNGYNTEDAELTKEQLNFFLDFKVDGKPLMQEKDILRLLDGARISDRKDVEEAVQEYQKEHPDDMRFSENNGLLGATVEKGKRFAYMMNGLNKKRASNEQAEFYPQPWIDDIYQEIRSGSTDNLQDLIKLNLYEESLSFNVLLEIITGEFTQPAEENVSDEHLQNSKDMLKFFLDLQVDGKPLMQEKDIWNLLERACDSGRKDVEETIQEYQKEHPDDKRFSENNGLLFATVGKGRRFAYRTAISSKKMVDKLNELSLQLDEQIYSSITKHRKQYFLADYLHRGIKNDPEDIKRFVKHNLRAGFISPDRILQAIEVEFTHFVEKGAPNEYIQNSKDMLNFFLDLELDGKPLMQEKDITKLFKNARSSGRKDVEEAILAYKAEHPDDKRFSEKMFEFNRKDKVAEFVKRQERKAAEVKFAAENAAKKAANKGASALTTAIKAAKSK